MIHDLKRKAEKGVVGR